MTSAFLFFHFPRSLVELILQQPALDPAVEERNASLRLEAHFLRKRRISREHIARVSLALLLEKIPDTLVQPFELRDLAHAFAIGRVHHDHAAPGQGRIPEIADAEFDQVLDARGHGILSCGLHRFAD